MEVSSAEQEPCTGKPKPLAVTESLEAEKMWASGTAQGSKSHLTASSLECEILGGGDFPFLSYGCHVTKWELENTL